jgi:hypothetical protein
MDHSTGNAGAIFAAHGSARQRVVRAAVVAGAALLAAWLIALALGVLGGFGSLPGLTHPSRSASSHEAGVRAHHTTRPAPVKDQQEVPVQTVAPSAVHETSSPTRSQSSTPAKTPSAPVTQQPTTSATSISTTSTHGQSSTHTTQTTGKPVGSPGNASGGSGAPGQLR